MSQKKTLRLHANDNVVVALQAIKAGTLLDNGKIILSEDIASGHKIATSVIQQGANILKYGQFIGCAKNLISPGAHIHTHNCEYVAPEQIYSFGTDIETGNSVGSDEETFFKGYRRENGLAATRNYIAIVSSVNCSASVAKYIADDFSQKDKLGAFPNIDGVVSFTHSTGCGMASSGDGFDNLERALWGTASHANVGGVLFVGLGCEVFQIPEMMEKYGLKHSDCFFHMTIQGTGGTRKTIEQGIDKVTEMLPLVNDVNRVPIPASELVLALQCGGSDAYSGITANPSLGVASDLIVSHGGTAILSETPEIYGAEHILTRRAVSQSVGEKLIERIKWWEGYTQRNGGSMNNNPSPGNKSGGLTTILEKSLGAAAKGGTAPLVGVYQYAERIDTRGFVFMDSPGYDPASITGQVAAGANVVCFTTGRGSAYGCKPSPSIKLATNTPMYNAMIEDMDINCGDVIEDGVTVEEKGREIFETILRIASGEKTRSELLGIGDYEFVPWQIGATM